MKKNKQPLIKIGAGLREQVWKVYCGENYTAECYVGCSNKINPFNFLCGHITAASKGGACELVNLRPICAYCNVKMNSKHMVIYIKELHFNSKLLNEKIPVYVQPVLIAPIPKLIIKNDVRCSIPLHIKMIVENPTKYISKTVTIKEIKNEFEEYSTERKNFDSCTETRIGIDMKKFFGKYYVKTDKSRKYVFPKNFDQIAETIKSTNIE
jgi:hypothetical protein